MRSLGCWHRSLPTSWGQIFEDTTVAAAMLDRLLHHATVIQINTTKPDSTSYALLQTRSPSRCELFDQPPVERWLRVEVELL